jgi:7-cyano-7-deazaguanine synthase
VQRQPVCVLVSGGVDSAVLVGQALREGGDVHPVYVRAGMAWENTEHACLERYLGAIAAASLLPLTTLSLPLDDVYGAHWSVGGAGAPDYDAPDEAVYLPGRNLVLLTKAGIFCALNAITRIAMGVLAGNPFPDATGDFFVDAQRALSRGLDHPLTIERPFASLHKPDVVRLGSHLPLELTFSCISPKAELHCGDCNKCAERQQGFREAGVPDRTSYAKQRGVV